MTDMIGRAARSGEYRAHRSVRQDSALSRYVAQGGSRTVGGAHQKEIRTWAAARQLIACYTVERALRAIERLRSGIAGLFRPITDARITAAYRKDWAENDAFIAWKLQPNPITKETLIRAMYAEASAKVELARDLEAEANHAQ